jgi:anti-sigma regulatory factor (Ser/Thr protein kinase)
MRTDRIPSDDRAATGARRWHVDLSGSGADGAPGAPAPGGATRRALSWWPFGPPMTPEGSDPRRGRGRGPGPGRSSPEPLPGDGVAIESSLVLENDVALIPPLLARLHETADRLGLFDARTADRVAVALTEALVNGIQHGNLELDSRLRREDEATYDRMAEFRRRRPPYRDRRLHVRARLSLAEAVYVIRDEGPGFDPATLPEPTDPSHLERTTGRGLLLIRAYMDEVAFNGAGNQVTLTKWRTTPPNAHDM